jgi:hypothetical protein
MADSVCFAVETVEKLIAFKAPTTAARDCWVDWICKSFEIPITQLTYKGDYEFIILDSSLPPKDSIVGKSQVVLEKYLTYSVSDLSAAFSILQQNNLNQIKGLEFKLLERNRASLTNSEVEQRLKIRIQVLEVDIESFSRCREAVLDLRAQLDEEHHKFESMKQKADRYYNKAVQSLTLQKSLKTELDISIEESHYLEKLVLFKRKAGLSSAKKAKLDALKHGFVGQCCLLDSLEPKAELGLYKKKLISVTQDGCFLQMKSMSLFSPHKTFLDLETVHSVIEGTESSELEPFEGMLYLTVMAESAVYVLAVDPRFGFYFEALQELFLDSNDFIVPDFSTTNQEALEGTLHQLKQQQVLVATYYDHWKKTQRDGICRAQPETCIDETKRVSTLAQIATVAFSGWSLEDYLRFERQELLKVEDSLNCLLADLELPNNS